MTPFRTPGFFFFLVLVWSVPLAFFPYAYDPFSTIKEFLLRICTAGIIVTNLSHLRAGLRLNFSFLCLLFYLLFCFLSFVLSVDRNLSAGPLINTLCFSLIFCIFRTLPPHKKDTLFFHSILACGIVSVYGILQALGLDPVEWVKNTKVQSESTLGNPNYLGLYLSVMTPLAAGYFFDSSGKMRGLMLACLFLSLSCLFASLHRAGMLACALSFMVFFSLSRKHLFIKERRGAIPLGKGMAFLFLFSGFFIVAFLKGPVAIQVLSRTQSIQVRFSSWNAAVEMFKERPLFGFGQGTFPLGFQKYDDGRLYGILGQSHIWIEDPHNEYLSQAASSGIGAFFSFLCLLSFCAFKGFAALNKSPDQFYKTCALVSALTAYAAGIFFVYPVAPTSLMSWMLLGWLSSLDLQDHKICAKNVLKGRKVIPVLAPVLVFLVSYFSFKPLLAGIYLRQGSALRERLPYYSMGQMERALRLEPSNTKPVYHLGDLYEEVASSAESLREKTYYYGLAVGIYRDALKRHPEEAALYNALGITYAKSGVFFPETFQKGEENLARAAHLHPMSPQYHHDLAVYYHFRGRQKKAKKEIKLALSIYPEFVEAKELLKKIQMSKFK